MYQHLVAPGHSHGVCMVSGELPSDFLKIAWVTKLWSISLWVPLGRQRGLIVKSAGGENWNLSLVDLGRCPSPRFARWSRALQICIQMYIMCIIAHTFSCFKFYTSTTSLVGVCSASMYQHLVVRGHSHGVCMVLMQHSKNVHAQGLLFDNKLRMDSHSHKSFHVWHISCILVNVDKHTDVSLLNNSAQKFCSWNNGAAVLRQMQQLALPTTRQTHAESCN